MTGRYSLESAPRRDSGRVPNSGYGAGRWGTLQVAEWDCVV